MTAERWQQVRAAFESVLAADPPHRAAILDEACRGDTQLREEVESLLAAHADETGFLKTAPRERFRPEPLIGRTVAHYQIHSTLGMGGMGIVYRAFDTHLERFIALKILPPETMSEPAREAFVREAKAASALNHPSIVTIYDAGHANEIHYIAMELIAGNTLAEMIAKHSLPREEALDYAIQIAGALSSAHGAGIVHRDIKPGNIMVTGSTGGQHGLAKILDFGLVTRGGVDDNPGSIRGTVSYMSPEQGEGQPADARSDLFSFGCTFYEMLAGRRAFPGGTKSEILARIREGSPDMSQDVPPDCRPVIRKCLERDPRHRFQTARELLAALRALESGASGRRRAIKLAAIAAGAVALLAAAGIVWFPRSTPPPEPGAWLQLTRFPDSVSQPSLSLDGTKVTFVRGPNTFAGPGQIYVKSLPDGAAVQLTHDNAQKMSPVFSPDSTQIAYSTADRQNRWETWIVPAAGGDTRQWLVNASGLTWWGKDRLLFSEIKDHDVHMAIVVSDANRGGSRDIYLPENVRSMAHRSYPSPDGKWILLVEMNPAGDFLQCRVVPADGSSAGHSVGPPNASCTSAAWSPDGGTMYLSAAVGGSFHTWRQGFPNGQPAQFTSGPTEEEGIAIDKSGKWFVTAVGLRQRSVWLHDRDGERQVASEGYTFDPKFTPDGKKLCYRILKGNDAALDPSELQILDLDSGRNDPLLPGIAMHGRQGWVYDLSADGRQVVSAATDREGKSRLWLAPVDRSSPARQVPGVEGERPQFTHDGDILFFAGGPPTYLWRVHPDGTGLRKLTEEPVLQHGELSPDGRWLPLRIIRPSAYLPVLYSLEGRPPIPISEPNATDFFLRWSPGGRWVFLSVPDSVTTDRGRTYAVPLTAGNLLPALPAEGPTEEQIAALPGAIRIDSLDAVPGPVAGTYAFAKETLLRNLFRIPLR